MFDSNAGMYKQLYHNVLSIQESSKPNFLWDLPGFLCLQSPPDA